MGSQAPKTESRGELPRYVFAGLPMPAVLSRASDDVVLAINNEYTAAYGI